MIQLELFPENSDLAYTFGWLRIGDVVRIHGYYYEIDSVIECSDGHYEYTYRPQGRPL